MVSCRIENEFTFKSTSMRTPNDDDDGICILENLMMKTANAYKIFFLLLFILVKFFIASVHEAWLFHLCRPPPNLIHFWHRQWIYNLIKFSDDDEYYDNRAVVKKKNHSR